MQPKLSFEVDDEDFPPRDIIKSQLSTREGRVGPNRVLETPRLLTKAARKIEDNARELLRKDYQALQDRLRASNLTIPFVFYDGADLPGGTCTVKRGDFVWLFLDKARKLGAQLAVGSDKSRRQWVRINVDDLMLVRDSLIISHHFDFHHFISNQTVGYNGELFPISTETGLPEDGRLAATTTREPHADEVIQSSVIGDAALTKVVDRRWYERNKHIFPASGWEEFDTTKYYATATRKDGQGNAYFKP